MSIESELERIEAAKANLRVSINAKGGNISQDATLDTYSSQIAVIGSTVTYNGCIYSPNFETCYGLQDLSLTNVAIHNSTTYIEDDAFKNSNNILAVKNITLGKRVKEIGSYAFYYTNLDSIIFPDSIEVIEENAFENAFLNISFMTQTLNLPSIEYIGDRAFMQSYYQQIKLGPNLRFLGASAFSSNRYLTNITIPGSLSKIGQNAFSECDALQSVVIEDGVTEIGSGAFLVNSRTQLTDVRIPSTLIKLGSNVFYGQSSLHYNQYDNAYYLGNENNPYIILVKAINTSIASCAIHNDCKFICDKAFQNCSSLTSLTIPKNVISIGEYFISYSGVQSITFANDTQLTEFCDNMFKSASSLTSITIPGVIKTIGANCFNGCQSLNNVVIEEGVEVIDNYAFNNCSALDTISIPNTLIDVGYNVFTQTPIETTPSQYTTQYDNGYYLGNTLNPYVLLIAVTSNDIASCVINAGAKIIGPSVFQSNTVLTSVTFDSNPTLKSISSAAFSGCTALSSFTIPNTVVSIEGSAFQNTGLTTIHIPDSVTELGERVFGSCSSLQSFTGANNVKEFKYGLFQYCTSLDNVVIPDSVELLDVAFYGCTGLTTITYGAGLKYTDGNTFGDCDNITTVNIPNLEVWGNIEDLNQGLNTSDTTPITASNGNAVLYINNVAVTDLSNYADTVIGKRTFEKYKTLTTINPPYGVTEIKAQAFKDVSCPIDLPASIMVLGEGAFRNNTNITEISIPATIETVPNYLFAGCNHLTSVVIPEGVKTIGMSAFSGCRLTSLTLPSTLQTINSNAFYGSLQQFTSVTIPRNVVFIDDAFEYNSKLTEVIFEEGSVLQKLDGTFERCSKITSITLPNGITNIGRGTFNACSSLTTISIPDTVTTLGQYVFEDCTSLQTAYIGAGVTYLDYGVFRGCSALQSFTLAASQKCGLGSYYDIPSQALTVYVPSNLISEYESDYSWSQCSNITFAAIAE